MNATMNIYAINGHKVRCTNLTAGWSDNSELYGQFIKVGDVYTVDFTIVHNSSTDVYLQEVVKGYPNNPNIRVKFNSCYFEDVNEQSIDDNKLHNDWDKYYN